MDVNGLTVRYVDSDEKLKQAAVAWRSAALIAVDTEFMRVKTFYPNAALFQISDERAISLIDPTAITDLSLLTEVLAAPSVLKLMHSCSEDLEVCDRHLGVLPDPLFDTQIAAAFCGHGLSVGYQRVLGDVLDLTLDKSETRTDWLQRPLSDAQLRYAAEDVAWLPSLYRQLQSQLVSASREQWALDECVAVLERFRSRDPAAEFSSVSGAARLSRRELAVLRSVYRWREQTARQRNLPKNWIMSDKALLQTAQRVPRALTDLKAIEDLSPGSRRRYGTLLVETVSDAMSLTDDALPEPLPKPLTPAQGKQFKKMRALLNECAEALNLAPELLARRRDLEEIVRSGRRAQVPLFTGWRRAACGEELLDRLEAGL